MIRVHRVVLIGCVSLGVSLGNLLGCVEKPPRLDPIRMQSIGDSISRGFDAWFIIENPALAWATGFHSPAEIGLGVPYILSHSQRIQLVHGSAGHVATNGAASGAAWSSGLTQAQAVPPTTTYVTVMLGGNDVCRGDGNDDGVFDIDDIPSVGAIRDRVANTLDELESRLPDGATVMVVGIPDIKAFRDVAVLEKGLLGIDCPAIWLTTAVGFPCGTMLSPLTTEASRTEVQQRNFEYNDAIEEETYDRALASDRIYYHFTDLENVAIEEQHISDIDCFHPSWEGQALISHIAWQSGPFAE